MYGRLYRYLKLNYIFIHCQYDLIEKILFFLLSSQILNLNIMNTKNLLSKDFINYSSKKERIL